MTPARTSKTLREWIPVVLGVLTAAAAVSAWTANAQIQSLTAPLRDRITILETRRESDSQRLERIEIKVDRVLQEKCP